MKIFLSCILYVLIWWTTLFVVLPLGVRPLADPDPVTGWRGTPDRVRFGRIILLTTIIALVVWVVATLVIRSPLFDFRNGRFALPGD